MDKEKIKSAYEALGQDWSWISLFIDFSNGFTFKKDAMIVAEAAGEIEKRETQLGIMWRPASLSDQLEIDNTPKDNVQGKSAEKCTLNDIELTERSNWLVGELCKSGGRSWSLRVPVDFNNDPDMLFIELGNRLGYKNARISELEAQNKELTEALEKINSLDSRNEDSPDLYDATQIAYKVLTRQALNPKSKDNG